MRLYHLGSAFSLSILLVSFLLVSIYVLPAHASEPTLLEILNSVGYTNIANSTVETFPPGRYNITLYAEFTDYFNSNELSFYQVGTGNFTPILEGSEGGSGLIPPLTKTFEADYQFGLSLSGNGTLPFRYFTESSRNPSGEQQCAIIYNSLDVPSVFLIGFDDRSYCTGLGDMDYNDMVFSLQLQYYLQVISPYDTPGGGGWYGNGTSAFASLADSIVNYGNGTRRVFTQWSGDASGTNYLKSDSIFMNQNRTAIANWKTQYYLTVGTIPSGLTTISGQDWYDQNLNVNLTAPPVSGYLFSYWDVDGVSQGNGLNPVTVNMNGPHTATAHYARAFVLAITTTSGGSTNPSPGTHTFNENSTVQVTAVPDANYVFGHWELDGTNVGSANPYTVLMNANHTLAAAFVYSPPPPPLLVTISPTAASIYEGQTVDFGSTITGGTSPYTYQWYLDGDAVSGATSSSWIATFAESGVHTVYLKVTDSKSNVARSNTALINVKPRPVGGYSLSLKGQDEAKPLTVYLTLVAASATAITAIKRKRTGKTR